MVHQNKHSNTIHISRHRVAFSPQSTAIKKSILVVIFLAAITVIVAVLCAILFKNENLIKSRIAALASDYYENYLYANFSTSEPYKTTNDLSTLMSKYESYGFAPVTLRQLLLHDNQKNAEYGDFLTTYCDDNATSVKFYTTPPYDKTAYRIEYTYSCNF